MSITPGGNIAPSLNSTVSRIEKLSEEKNAIQADIREVYREAKEKGLNVRTVKEVIKLRKLNAGERQEQQHLRDVYLHALGLLDTVGGD